MGQKFSTSLDLAHLATPANPAASRSLLYIKSDGELYTKSSAGVEKLVGAGQFSLPSHIHSPGAWQTMTGLASPWANGSVGPRYRLENDGYVLRLSGAVTRPSGSVAQFYTLPVGFRPDRGHNFAVTATSAFGRLTITTAGGIQLNQGTATGDVFLDGITVAIV